MKVIRSNERFTIGNQHKISTFTEYIFYLNIASRLLTCHGSIFLICLSLTELWLLEFDAIWAVTKLLAPAIFHSLSLCKLKRFPTDQVTPFFYKQQFFKQYQAKIS